MDQDSVRDVGPYGEWITGYSLMLSILYQAAGRIQVLSELIHNTARLSVQACAIML